MRSEHMA